MKSEITLTLRQFPVLAHDHRTGQEEAITVTVTKEQLQAAHIVGQSSKELIERMLDRQGYTAIEIGAPDKLAITVDLDKLVEQHEEQAKWNYLCGDGGEDRDELAQLDIVNDITGEAVLDEEKITRADLEFLLGCALDLAKCLEQDAKDHFDNSCCGAGEFAKDDIQISGNLLNRAAELRSYVKELAEKYSVVMDDG